VNRPSGLGLKAPMTADQARSFAARIRGEIIQVSCRIPPANAAPTRPTGGDQDIPF